MPEAATLRSPDVLDQLQAAWRRSDALFALLEEGAWLQRPIALRQPLIFYVGHLPAFAWNQLNRGLLKEPSFNPGFDALFEFGIDPLDEGDVPEEPDWPDMADILAYRDEIRHRVLVAAPLVDALAERDAGERVAQGRRIYHVLLEHEVMHHETLLYMVAQLDESLKDAPAASLAGRHAAAGAIPQARIAIPAGTTTLGVPFDEIPFGWDNEFPAQEVDVPAFAIDALPVSNDDYLAFVEAGGYAQQEHWSEAAWAWRLEQQLEHPHNWARHDGHWLVRGPFDSRPFHEVASRPVQVSQAEAAAYCAWSGARLPTEAELNRAAYETPENTRRLHPWGDAPPGPEYGAFDFLLWEPAPVGSHPAGASAWGVHELVGNGWELTCTPFRPLPGFEAWVPGYPGYSADFFDDLHTVVFGGSWATGRALLRRSFRNWFQPHYPFVFSKFRRAWP